ncbi:pentapeptide repeat-containing protein, partial [Rothia nasisuis]|uniref:pentapeptide repeat-containing protein n=1 Tax=Rothia nasisuis TaxID=2109647 RepID=UPI001F461E6B
MAKEPTVENRSEKRPVRGRDLSSWLVTLAWGAGFIIYAWLLSGAVFGFDYRNLIFNRKGVVVWCLAVIIVFIIGALSLRGAPVKKSADRENRQLFRIVVAVLPALFLVSALAVLVLTLATYNGDWKEARQGIATAFAALIAAVGVVVSVVVSYRTGEENRIAQQENLKTQLESQQRNLETQLEHQRALENDKGEREQQKLDAELIKNLNDRLHEVIARRYSSGDDKDTSGLVSASYFQLASLYRDWETLSKTSDLIALQKESQQRNILKLLFGVYQESDEKNSTAKKNTSDEKNSSERSEVDIRTLNSVIQDIFPEVERKKNSVSTSAQKEDVEYKTPDGQQGTFDLSYLDLRGLDLSRRDLRGANLIGARLERAYLVGADLAGANLGDAHLEGAYLVGADLAGADLIRAGLEG